MLSFLPLAPPWAYTLHLKPTWQDLLANRSTWNLVSWQNKIDAFRLSAEANLGYGVCTLIVVLLWLNIQLKELGVIIPWQWKFSDKDLKYMWAFWSKLIGCMCKLSIWKKKKKLYGVYDLFVQNLFKKLGVHGFYDPYLVALCYNRTLNIDLKYRFVKWKFVQWQWQLLRKILFKKKKKTAS